MVDQGDAEVRFMILREVLPLLVRHMPYEIINQQGLQAVCDLVRDHQTWTVAHVAAYFGYARLFQQPEVVRYFICCLFVFIYYYIYLVVVYSASATLLTYICPVIPLVVIHFLPVSPLRVG